nr:bacteriocin-protection protein [Propionibacterium sp.]
MARQEREPVLYPRSAVELRTWLQAHHQTATELWIGLRHQDPERPLWADLVDELLCFGWIDSVVHPVEEGRVIRVTPRRADSMWSPRNLTRAAILRSEGRMTPAGEAALSRRLTAPGYGADGHWRLDTDAEAELRAGPAAWAFFEVQPANFREQVAYWVMSAKRPVTRSRRLQILRAAFREGHRPTQLTRRPEPQGPN